MKLLANFIQIAHRHKRRDAIIFNNERLSYEELNEISNQIAHELVSHSIGAGNIVGVSLKRSPHQIAAILAVLKVGATYLPLDPEYPKERLLYMLEKSKANLTITQEELAGFFPAQKLLLIENKNIFKNSKKDIFFESLRDLAGYCIFTSGSTGLPKGVNLGRAALDNLIEWQNKESTNILSNITLQFTPISFDVHFQEIFSTLSVGGTLVLIDEMTRLDTTKLIDILNDNKVTRLFLPFVALNQLCETALSLNKKLETLVDITTAGEQLRVTESIREFFRSHSKIKLHNHYGPSESHVVSSLTLSEDVSSWENLPSIGYPIDNVELFILDEKMNEVSPLSEGELYIKGICLALGYVNDSEKTDERFINHPKLGRIYKTGDLVKINNDFSIQCLGRLDGQVKIRGHRVELGEIEVQILKNKKITKAACKILAHNDAFIICAYVVGAVDSLEVIGDIKKSLPDYMLPSFVVNLETMPLTPSGKIDYKNLPIVDFSKRDKKDFKLSNNEYEEKILSIWLNLLKYNAIGVDENFFDIGGTSLLAVKMLVELKKEFTNDISITDIFEYTTIEKLSERLSQNNENQLEIRVKPQEGNNSASHDIAIVAMNGRFPSAKNINEFWHKILEAKNCINLFKEEETNPFSEKMLGNENFIKASGHFNGMKSFDYKLFNMTPRESELMDPQQRKYLELCFEALELAGINPDKTKSLIGVFAGSGNSRYAKVIEQYPEKVDQLGEFNVMLGLEKDYIATRVAYKLNLKGPAISIHTACSTSLVAIIEAVKHLRDHDCDVALAGGISISGLENTGHLYQEGGILSIDGKCRPYDKNATGTVFTEGAGVLVLKRLTDAIKDKDTIHAVIKGVGLNNDGADKMSFTAPSVDGQARAILMAQMDAGISADEIEFIEGHGTATPIGDPIEIEALRKAFRKTTQKNQFCNLGSLKSNFGHLTGAAGVAGVIKAALSVKSGIIPALANFEEENPYLNLKESPFVIHKEQQSYKQTKKRAAVSSFGVGGTNAHVIIENYDNQNIDPETVKNEDYYLFKLQAKTKEQAEILAQNLISYLKVLDESKWPNVAYSLDVGRRDFNHKVSLALKNKADLEKVKIISNEAKKAKKLIYLFAGQGAFYSQMGLELYTKNLFFRDLINECFDKYKKITGRNLREIVFGNNSEEDFKNTLYSQPAIFIFQYTLAKTLKIFGVEAQGYLGHSIGEFAAATLSGVFSFDDALKAICKRAELMQKLSPGAMLSINLDEEKTTALIANYKLDIAAINARNSIVVSGNLLEIERFQNDLKEKQIAGVLLKTSHAFHSRMMVDVKDEYLVYLSALELKEPKEPLLSSVTGTYEKELWAKPSYWANHIVNPVNFYKATLELLKDEDLLLLEVSAKNVLSQLVKKAVVDLKMDKVKIYPLLSLGLETEEKSFIQSLGHLWSEGLKVNTLDYFYNEEDKKKVEAPTYPFSDNKVWLEPKKNIEKKSQMFTKEKIMKNSLNQLEKKLVDIFEEASGVEVGGYSKDTEFLEMGMDSLFLTQVSLMLKKELKVEITFRDLMEKYSNIELLGQYLDGKVTLKNQETPKISNESLKTIDVKEIMQNISEPKSQAIDMNKMQVSKNENSRMQTVAKTQAMPVQSMPINLVMNQNHLPSMDGIAGIVAKQLELMSMQLQMLAGNQIQMPMNMNPTQVLNNLPAQNENYEAPVMQAQAETRAPNVQEVKEIKSKGVNNLKDAFGAQARISTDKTMDLESNKEVMKFFKEYIARTQKSKDFTEKNRKNHADPRVVTGFKPEVKEIVYPIVVKRSHMQTLVDLDNNKYVDMTCGFGSNFFGNGNERIKKYVINQIEEGIELGPQHPLVEDVSRLINELTGNERTAFCNTGSEAVLGAMRIARTVTGRDKIICFSGSYHGINDEVILRGAKNGKTYPAAPGINSDSVSNMIVLDYGTPEALEKIRELAGEVAAVLVEPVQSRRSDFHPKEFLEEVRKITLANDTCLIFDEIITGFRVHPAGAQGYFGIRADLCTYGKIVGGGMPIGVISGKSTFMDALDGGHWRFGDDSTPTVGVTYFAGTFVRHPLALAAAKGALEILKEGGVTLLSDLSGLAQSFVDEVNNYLDIENAPIKLDNFGPLMKPKWKKDTYGGEILFALLRFNGVHVYDGFPWFVNLAHTQEELNFVVDAIKKSVKEMQRMGLFPQGAAGAQVDVDIDFSVLEKTGAPMLGAKIGKDENGNPAWFIEDPENVGQYYKIKRS